MNRLRTVVFATALILSVAGCETTEYYEGSTRVFSHTVPFRMRDATINGNVASVQYEMPDITSNVLEYGAVLAFFREQGTWTAMPYTFGVESPDLPAVDYTISIGYAFDRRFLEVFYEASTAEVDLRDMPDTDVKVVIIEDIGYGKQSIDLTDYEQVRAFYGLRD